MLNLTVIYCAELDKNLHAERNQGLNSVCAKIHRWPFSQTNGLEEDKWNLESCAGIQSPYLPSAHAASLPARNGHLSAVSEELGWTNGMGSWNGGRNKTGSFPVPLHTMNRGWMLAIDHRAGVQDAVGLVHTRTLITQPPPNIFSSVNCNTKSCGGERAQMIKKNSVETVLLGGGIWSHKWI